MSCLKYLFLCSVIFLKTNDVFGGISEEKCWEYSQIIKNIVGIDLQPFSPPTTPVNSDLGKEETLPAEFPHMAHLGYVEGKDIKWLCGGALISDEYVLTSAVCTKNPKKTLSYIRLGATDINNPADANVQMFIPQQIVVPPERKAPESYHDIALIKLDKKVTFTKFVLPACLETQNITNDLSYVATGWGLTQKFGNSSDKLMKVTLESFTKNECSMTYPPMRRLQHGITDGQLCVGGRTEPRSTCQGDSGGPVQIYKSRNPNIYQIAGIISFGKVCGIVGEPEVATRVASYVPWIESQVWP